MGSPQTTRVDPRLNLCYTPPNNGSWESPAGRRQTTLKG